MQFPLTLAYNMKAMKIGCPITQAEMGATILPGYINMHFEQDTWQTHKEGLVLYKVTDQMELDFIEDKTHEKSFTGNIFI